ncbi:MAG: VanZ family protein [Deltaproteobacteria bacterium]|nr:VanZ family protein [Deltaproteobacteria bacterium]
MNRNFQRIVLWTLVTAYTIALPDANVVYDTIATHFSHFVAGKVPIVIILIFGISYAGLGIITQKSPQYYFLLIPCVIIVLAVLYFEPNPNKHIHIPEYIVMSWLLYEALSIDYTGKGIFFLTFVCAAMLGIVDELAQGVYPERYFGGIDMGINSASSIIGILTLMGIKNRPKGNWAWTDGLRTRKNSLGHLAFGVTGAVLLCVYLFNVKATGTFRGAYPPWLFMWNCFFLILSPVIFLYSHRRVRKHVSYGNEKDNNVYANELTAHLWIVVPLAILFVMHAVAVFVGLSGVTFT